MDIRRKAIRQRDIISFGRRKPRCDFMSIREEVLSVQKDILLLKETSSRIRSRASKRKIVSSDIVKV